MSAELAGHSRTQFWAHRVYGPGNYHFTGATFTKRFGRHDGGRERLVAKGESQPSSLYEGIRFSRFGWDSIPRSITQGMVMDSLTMIRRDKLRLTYPASTKSVTATTDGECCRAWLVSALGGNAGRF